jgi:hypothetical protein
VWRKIRTAVTMLVLIGILCAGAWYGWTRLSEAGAEFTDDPAAAPSEECATPDPVTARAGQTVVSVFNAGAPTGSGGLVMDALEARNFQRGALANAPSDVDVDGLEVWATDIESPEAQLVARQLRRAELVQRLTTPGPGVNIIVGREFDSLRKAPRRLTVEPEPSC